MKRHKKLLLNLVFAAVILASSVANAFGIIKM